MRIIDTNRFKKKFVPKRKYHDGDIVEFNFEPNSIDIYWYDIILIGVISGVLYEKEGILYKVQLKDKKRNIFGDIIVPEKQINRKIEDHMETIKCHLCEKLVHVGRLNYGDEEDNKEIKKWKRFYCLGKDHHIINICPVCLDGTDTEQNLKCPYDHCDTMSEQKKELLYKNGIRLTDNI